MASTEKIVEKRNWINVFGSSYMCGADIVQRILNTIDGVLILGEDNTLIHHFGTQLQSAVNNEERISKQCEDFGSEKNDCWQANLGLKPKLLWSASASYYYELFLGFIEQNNITQKIHTFGFTSLFAKESAIIATNALFGNGYRIYIRRNLKDSFKQYVSCPWYNPSYHIGNFASSWTESIVAAETALKNGIIHEIIDYENISDVGWVARLADRMSLNIDYQKIENVLKTKIVDDSEYVEKYRPLNNIENAVISNLY